MRVLGHEVTSPTERLPAVESHRSRDELLGIRQLEALRQDFSVGQAAVAGQHRSKSRGNRIVLLTVPAQIQLRLFSGDGRC